MTTITDTWTIQAALNWTEKYLQEKGDESPLLSAQWLIGHVTHLSRLELYAHFDRPLNMSERALLRLLVTRRGKGEPLQYLTEEVEFRHITLKVRSGVLIPRPETEVLVSEALALLDKPVREFLRDTQTEGTDEGVAGFTEESLVEDAQSYLVADIGTGSGCIAASIAHEHPATRVIATDISPEAVALAESNIKKLKLEDRVTVIQSDLGSAISSEDRGCFDLVVSNPPYVPTEILKAIPSEVSEFEPALALDGGSDGFAVFRPLLTWSFSALKSGGALAVELHEDCLDKAADLAQKACFEKVTIMQDLAGRPRILTAKKPE